MNKKHKDDSVLNQVTSWKEMLQAKPVKNAVVDVQQCEYKKIKITVKKEKHRFLVPPISWIIRPKLKRTMVLDNIGTQVWNLCDGRQTVEDVIDEFSKMYNLTFHEARVSVTGYIKLLIQRGALAIIK